MFGPVNVGVRIVIIVEIDVGLLETLVGQALCQNNDLVKGCS